MLNKKPALVERTAGKWLSIQICQICKFKSKTVITIIEHIERVHNMDGIYIDEASNLTKAQLKVVKNIKLNG